MTRSGSKIVLWGICTVASLTGCRTSGDTARSLASLRAVVPDTLPFWDCNAQPDTTYRQGVAAESRLVHLVSRIDATWLPLDPDTIQYRATVWSPGSARDTVGGYTSYVAHLEPRVDTVLVIFSRGQAGAWTRQCPAKMRPYLPFDGLADPGFYYNRDEFDRMVRWKDSIGPGPHQSLGGGR